MTVAWRAQGTVGIGSTSVTPGLPASLATGEGVLIMVVTKPDTATIGTPTDWTPVANIAGGGGSNGNGTGPTRQAWFWREKNAGWSTMPAVAITSGNSSAAIASVYTKDAAADWIAPASATTTFGTGAATTDGAATLGSDPGFTASDLAVVGYSTQDEAPTWSAQAITATGVSAWGTATEQSEAVETTTGSDIGGMYFTRPVTTGTSSAAPVIAATLSVAGRGTVVGIRLREVILIAGTDAGSIAADDASAITAGITASESRSLRAVEGQDLDKGIANRHPNPSFETELGTILEAVNATATRVTGEGAWDGDAHAVIETTAGGQARLLFDRTPVLPSTQYRLTARFRLRSGTAGSPQMLIADVDHSGAVGSSAAHALPALTSQWIAHTFAVTSTVPALDVGYLAVGYFGAAAAVGEVEVDGLQVTLYTEPTVDDRASLSIADVAAVVVVFAEISATDTASIAAADASGLVVTFEIAVSDTASLAIADASEVAVTLAAIEATDTASLAVVEDAQVAVGLTASETRSLAVAEGLDLYTGINNRYPDPSFETGLVTTSVTNATVERVTGQNAWDGDALVLVTTTAAGGNPTVRFQRTPVLPGADYRATVRLRSRSGSTNIRIETQHYISSGALGAGGSSPVTLTTAWQQFTFTATTTSLSSYLAIGLMRLTAADAEIEVDGLQITPGTGSPAYDPYSAITTRYGAETAGLAVADPSVLDDDPPETIAGTDTASLAVADAGAVVVSKAAADEGGVRAWEGLDLFTGVHNRYPDPSFETALGENLAPLDPVGVWNATVERVTGQNAWDGDAHVLATTPAVEDFPPFVEFAAMRVLANTTYNLALRHRSRSGETTGQIWVATLNVLGGWDDYLNYGDEDFTATGDWGVFETSFTTFDVSAYVIVAFDRDTIVASEMEFDGLQIAPQDDWTAAFDPASITTRYGTDTAGLAVAEVADASEVGAAEPIVGTDTASLAIAEALDLLVLVDATDTASLAVAEGSGQVGVVTLAFEVTDTASLAVDEAVTVTVLLDATDTASLAAAEDASAAAMAGVGNAFTAVASTVNDDTYATGSFTPVAGTLLVVFASATATTATTPTMVASANGLTFTRLSTRALRNSSADTIYAYVANQLVPASPAAMTLTFDCPQDAATGCIVSGAAVSGIVKVGTAAIRQAAEDSNVEGGTAPSTTFGSAVLTVNPTLFAVGTTVQTGTSPPSGWTERVDVSHATPAAGGGYASRNSGFTGTTITLGSTTNGLCAAIALELDMSEYFSGWGIAL